MRFNKGAASIVQSDGSSEASINSTPLFQEDREKEKMPHIVQEFITNRRQCSRWRSTVAHVTQLFVHY